MYRALTNANYSCMYYCSRSKDIPYSLEKIQQRIRELWEIIPPLYALPAEEEMWVGHLNFGHPVTEFVIELRVLWFLEKHPPDPRGEPMFCRYGPYVERAYAKDLAIALGIPLRTIQRAMKVVHEKLELKVRSWITVDEFINMIELPNRDVIHERLSLLLQERWKQIEDKHKLDDDEDKDDDE
ncbi:MAG TPA: hypothetical protein VF008_20775 [Niastella sp.]